MCQDFILFWGCIIVQCTYTPRCAHLSVCFRHLDCFHVLATVPNAVTSVVRKYLSQTLLSVLLGLCTELELWDHIVILVLIFWRPPYCFPQQLHRFTSPPPRTRCGACFPGAAARMNAPEPDRQENSALGKTVRSSGWEAAPGLAPVGPTAHLGRCLETKGLKTHLLT